MQKPEQNTHIKNEILKNFGDKVRVRVCGIWIEQDQILMVKHQYIGQFDYLWAPPGGGMHFGESAAECLQREFWEETGLEIKIGDFLFVHEFQNDPLHAIELFFEVKRIGGHLHQGRDPELSPGNQIITQVAFLNLDTLKKENPLQIHAVFRNIENLSFILKKNGYYQSKN